MLKHALWKQYQNKCSWNLVLKRIDLMKSQPWKDLCYPCLNSPKTKGTKSFQASGHILVYTYKKKSNHGFNESIKRYCTIRISSFRINHCLKPWSGVLYMANSHTVAVPVPNAMFYIEYLFYIEFRIYTCTVTCI